jgi:hypothetical protein
MADHSMVHNNTQPGGITATPGSCNHSSIESVVHSSLPDTHVRHMLCKSKSLQDAGFRLFGDQTAALMPRTASYRHSNCHAKALCVTITTKNNHDGLMLHTPHIVQ